MFFIIFSTENSTSTKNSLLLKIQSIFIIPFLNNKCVANMHFSLLLYFIQIFKFKKSEKENKTLGAEGHSLTQRNAFAFTLTVFIGRQ